ncbi:MAG: mechanosensitive ion channel family protein [Lachnospiraceae bacterium]|jgi:small conductance mechanosensitive channel|nr:mechanosensitive ion channel family protein [Lachnospiraceae bacterium]MCI9397330.1 mechanosensitive ion channel family protein [Lachnospiraceae bacterium]
MEDQAVQEQIKEIEYIASDELNVGLIERYLQELPDKLIRLGVRVLLALVVFFIGVQLIKLVRRILRKSFERRNVDMGVSRFLDSLVKTVLYMLLLFMIASSFGLDATSVVALVGSAGVAIGLAVQGSLSNFAGGVLILLLKPFKVGDYVRDAAGNEGTVEEVQLFYTRMITPDRHMVVVPNGDLANGNILNMSTLGDRRMDIKVGISYESDIRRAKEVLLRVLDEDPGVLQEEEKRVFVEELADSAVILCVRCYSANENFWETRWRLMETIKYALDEAGIGIPFPQIDVHMREN